MVTHTMRKSAIKAEKLVGISPEERRMPVINMPMKNPNQAGIRAVAICRAKLYPSSRASMTNNDKLVMTKKHPVAINKNIQMNVLSSRTDKFAPIPHITRATIRPKVMTLWPMLGAMMRSTPNFLPNIAIKKPINIDSKIPG